MSMADRGKAHDPQMVFVFSDKTALQAVQFRDFTEDWRKIMGGVDESETLIEQERQRVWDYLERMHQDILHNFDLRILRFRKNGR